MNLRRILAIMDKDLRDAMRDGRVLVLLLLPIGMALFYNATVDDEDKLPTQDVALVGDAAVGQALERAAGDSVDVSIRRAADAADARELVDDDAVDLGIVVNAADDVDVLVPDDADPTTQALVALVPIAAGQKPSSGVNVQRVAPSDPLPADVIGARTVTVLISIVLLATFIALMVVPIQTAEEVETGTFGALRLAATGPEILAAKGLAGALYSAIGVILIVVLTSIGVEEPVPFVLAAVAMVASLVGFGMLFGLAVANATTINTYGGVALIPFVGLAVAVFFVDSGVLKTILDVLPFSQATRLMGDAVSGASPFDAGAVSWAVVLAWALAGYGLLMRFARTREF